MHSDIESILIDRDTLARRIDEVAREIIRDHPRSPDQGGPASQLQLTIVPVLTGSIIFVADLLRHLPFYVQLKMLWISSYPGRATASQGAIIRGELGDDVDLAGQHVLVVDDILDSGQTMQLVRETLVQRRPTSLRTCVLLRKQRPQALQCPVDYVCFDVPDRFVVGFGLDYNGFYRNLPDIVTLRSEVTASS